MEEDKDGFDAREDEMVAELSADGEFRGITEDPPAEGDSEGATASLSVERGGQELVGLCMYAPAQRPAAQLCAKTHDWLLGV